MFLVQFLFNLQDLCTIFSPLQTQFFANVDKLLAEMLVNFGQALSKRIDVLLDVGQLLTDCLPNVANALKVTCILIVR